MIYLHPSATSSKNQRPAPAIRVIGIGNAGVNIVDRATIHAKDELACIAMNTDAQSLTASVVPYKLLIGQQITRGFGTGGDTQLAIEAAKESANELGDACQNTEVLILIGGLGGGTGSILLPHLATTAKSQNKLVFAITTLPFSFEGPRRNQLAKDALEQLRSTADLVIAFENDRITELADPVGPLTDAFSNTDILLALVLDSLLQALQGSGPMNISANDFLHYLRSSIGPQWFAYGQSSSPNRAHDVVNQALKSPLIARDANFEQANSLLIHLRGPQNLSFVEVQAILQNLLREVGEDTAISLGISTIDEDDGPLQLAIFACINEAPPLQTRTPLIPAKLSDSTNLSTAINQEHSVPAPPTSHLRADFSIPSLEDSIPVIAIEPTPVPLSSYRENGIADALASQQSVSSRNQSELFHAAELPHPNKTPMQSFSKKPIPKITQETLPFEPVARGRFEKSEPTIIEGEDLDVPTFLRRRIRIK